MEISPQPLAIFIGSGGRIRTIDLRVMSPTSYLTAPPRVKYVPYRKMVILVN